jgi:hypothetical protein
MNKMYTNSHRILVEYTLDNGILVGYLDIDIELDLNNNGVICIKPFGTSRTRFETRKVLDISTTFIKNIDEMNRWEVRLIKNKTELCRSRNERLFYEDTFKIPLELWIPPPPRPLTLDALYTLFPQNYGTIECSLISEKPKYTLGIVVPFYSRADYVLQFLTSLKNTNLDDCLIVFVDESMTKNVDEDHIEVNKLVKGFEMINVSIIKVYKNVHGNMFDSILYGMDFLYTYCEFLSTIDSDTIHKPDWIESLFEGHRECTEDHPGCDILLSGFNTVTTRHTVREKRNKYILKDSVGGCHMLFSKEMYIKSIRRCMISHKWDSNIIESVREFGTKVVTTNPSVVQHIGVTTSIDGRVAGGSPNTAMDFV